MADLFFEPGESNLWLRQGQTVIFEQTWVTKVSTRHLGTWSATTAYVTNDVVTSNGIDYVALRDNLNVTPTVGPDWGLNKATLDITGYKIRISFAAADSAGNPIGDTLFAVSTTEPTEAGSAITIKNGPGGVVGIKFADEDLAAVPVMQIRDLEGDIIDKRGVWDEELENPAGDVLYVVQGRVSVKPEVSGRVLT